MEGQASAMNRHHTHIHNLTYACFEDGIRMKMVYVCAFRMPLEKMRRVVKHLYYTRRSEYKRLSFTLLTRQCWLRGPFGVCQVLASSVDRSNIIMVSPWCQCIHIHSTATTASTATRT